MNRYFHSLKYKAHMQRTARRSLTRQLRFKDRQRHERQWEQGISRSRLKQINRLKHQQFPYTPVHAPEHFSFVDNPEGMIRFIAQLETYFTQRKPVYVVLSDVKLLDHGAVAVLLSVMVRFKSHLIPFNGDLPNDLFARNLLFECHFFDHLNRRFRELDKYELTGQSTIFTHAMRKVDSALGEKLIDASSTTVWGLSKRCPGVQRALIELMHNTNNHASLKGEGEKHWWLSVKHIPEENTVAFSFVDYGIGVFQSLEQKPAESKFFNAVSKLLGSAYNRLVYGNNADILRRIFSGELHRTATGKDYRGKGLPGVYHAYQENKFSDFVMITNDAMYDSRSDTYKTLSKPFGGTFVYWTLTPKNSSLPHDNKS